MICTRVRMYMCACITKKNATHIACDNSRTLMLTYRKFFSVTQRGHASIDNASGVTIQRIL